VFATGSAVLYISIAVASALLGVLIAGLVLRYTALRPPFDFGAVDALVGIVYGILLAILVLFASEHYSAAITNADKEATSLNDIYKAAGTLQPTARDDLRHQVICYAREKIELEWPSLRNSDGKGSPVLFARTRELNNQIEEIARAEPTNLIVSTLFNANLTRAEARQLMLEDSRPELPKPLWLVVLLGIGIVVFLLSIRYWEEKSHLIAALLASLALLVAMVGALAELDRPFASVIGLQPRAMESVLTSVVQSSTQSPVVFRPCADTASAS
jgi:Protein of unknown function (DUF4239)